MMMLQVVVMMLQVLVMMSRSTLRGSFLGFLVSVRTRLAGDIGSMFVLLGATTSDDGPSRPCRRSLVWLGKVM